jgi:hypothetical protein
MESKDDPWEGIIEARANMQRAAESIRARRALGVRLNHTKVTISHRASVWLRHISPLKSIAFASCLSPESGGLCEFTIATPRLPVIAKPLD